MAGLKEIRKRIQSVKNTQKITRAMKMIAATKLRKAQSTMLSTRKFSVEMRKMAHFLIHKVEKIHPLMIARAEIKNEAVIVVSGDRGLCGSFNASIVRYTKKYIADRKKEGVNSTIFFIGKKAGESLRMVDAEKNYDFINLFQDLQFNYMFDLVDLIADNYISGKFDLVTVVYNRFKSAVSQEVTKDQIFPLVEDTFAHEEEVKDKENRDLIIEPSPEELFDFIVKRFAATELYHDLMESVASEFSARMNAMDSATKNAEEMISHLVLLYNRVRQDAITKELMEIIGGAEALK